MIVSIAQPTYLPWLGYFDLIARADVFVFLDTVQFEKQSWQSRNRLKGSDNMPFWLSVPIATHPLATPICEIQIAPNKSQWSRKHLQSLQTVLAKMPFFDDTMAILEPVLLEKHTHLSELNISLITGAARNLGLTTRFVRASEMSVAGNKTDLILAILERLQATHYRCNAGSRAYMEDERPRFESAEISWEYQLWETPSQLQDSIETTGHLAFPDAFSCLGLDNLSQYLLSTKSHGPL